MSLATLKHCGNWDWITRIFGMKVPPFERVISPCILQGMGNNIRLVCGNMVGGINDEQELYKARKVSKLPFRSLCDIRYIKASLKTLRKRSRGISLLIG